MKARKIIIRERITSRFEWQNIKIEWNMASFRKTCDYNENF